MIAGLVRFAAWASLAHDLYMVEISDMPTVEERELARLRAMTAEEKLRVSDRLWREAHALARAVVAQRHPAWSSEQVTAETRRLMSGGRA